MMDSDDSHDEKPFPIPLQFPSFIEIKTEEDSDEDVKPPISIQPQVIYKEASPDPNVTCHICQASFSNRSGLTNHLKKHVGQGQNPYICSLCPQTFGDTNALNLHLGTAHPEDYTHREKRGKITVCHKKHCCPHCPKKFVGQTELGRHLVSHTGERPYDCKECGAKFTQKQILRAHMAEKHTVKADKKPELKFKCEVCYVVYKTLPSLRKHQRRKGHGEPDATKPSQSKKPQKAAVSPVVISDRPHICPLCRKSFQYIRGLKAHLPSHGSQIDQVPDPFRCHLCSETFGNAEALTLHLGAAHPEDYTIAKKTKEGTVMALRLKVTCPHCPKKLLGPAYLERHLGAHQKERPYVCRECGLSYKTKDTLTAHITAKHPEMPPNSEDGLEIRERPSPSEPVNCGVCGRIYKNLKCLQAHQRVSGHLDSNSVKRPRWRPGEQVKKEASPYICLFCGKDLKRSWLLVVHNRTHTGERPFSCNACGKTFSSRFNRLKHVQRVCPAMVAMGIPKNKIRVKEAKCPLCNFSCPTSKIARHTALHGTEFVCEICQVGFKKRHALARHKRTAHQAILRQFKCEAEGCGRIFTSAKSFSSHKSRFHRGWGKNKNNGQNNMEANDSIAGEEEMMVFVKADPEGDEHKFKQEDPDSVFINGTPEEDGPKFKLEAPDSAEWGEEILGLSHEPSEDDLDIDMKPFALNIKLT